MVLFIFSLISCFYIHFKYGEATLLTTILIATMVFSVFFVLFSGTVPEIIFLDWVIEIRKKLEKRFFYKKVAKKYNWTKIREMKKADDFLKLCKELFDRSLYNDEIKIDYLEPVLHRILRLMKKRTSFFSKENIDALISIEKILEENNLETINLAIRIFEILEDKIIE